MARPEGSPNKNKAFLLKRLQGMYGEDFHPIMKMAENAVKLQAASDQDPEPANYKAALDGWEKIAQYVEPKLKAVEVSGGVEIGAIDMTEWSTEQINAYISRHTEL